MIRKFTLLLAIIILVSGCSIQINGQPSKQANIEAKKMPPEGFLPKNLHIVAVGDSLTQGVGDSTNRGGYLPYLKEIMEKEKGIGSFTFENFGIKGDRTDQLLARLKQPKVMTEIKKADIVTVTIGGNDVMKVFRENFTNLQVDKFETAINGYQKRLNEIIQTIREYKPDVGIVLIGIYNPFEKWFSDIKELDEIVNDWNNASAQTLMQFKNTQFIPISDIFENQNVNLFYSDDFHPNDTGYQLMAKRIGEYLSKNELKQLRQ